MLLDSLSASVKSSLRRGSQALLGIGATLVVVQGLSLLANILVVRSLTVTEYAILTSSLSIIGVLEALADSGLAQAALTVGGLHHDSVNEKGQVLRRCRQLIIRTGAIASLIVVPMWFFMAQRIGVGTWSMASMAVVLFGGFFATLGFNIFKSFLLLEGHRVMLQKIEVIKTLVRVLLLFVGLWSFPNAIYVITSSSLIQIGAWWYSKQALSHLTLLRIEPSSDIKDEVASIFWRVMPARIYKATSSQIFLLLLVAFGSTGGVAGAGALGRFHQFYMVVSSISASIFAPRLARTQGTSVLSKKFVHYTAASWFAAIVVCATVIIVSRPFLQLFGPAYTHLVPELQVFMVAGCMHVMVNVLTSMLNNCGWVMPPALIIGIDFSFTALAILICDVSTLWGYIWMNCIVKGACLLTATGWAAYCLMRGKFTEVLR